MIQSNTTRNPLDNIIAMETQAVGILAVTLSYAVYWQFTGHII